MVPARLLLLGALPGMLLCGCRRSPSPPASKAAHRFSSVRTDSPLPGALTRAQQVSLLLEGLHKRIRGRRTSLADIERIVHTIAPLVVSAADQPRVQPVFARIAADRGVSIAAAKSHWIALQEGDLLLESGGDPDSASPAGAVGVAQWLAGTGRGAGLRVDLPRSRRLTQQIESLRLQLAWTNYLSRPDADRSAPGLPGALAGRAELVAEIEQETALRREADARYDPAQAITAQTAYLLRLYRRFPGEDWLFQAYHGGEAGVARTLKFYMGHRWPGSAAEAIRHGAAGERLTYEAVYFTCSPGSHAEAFRYLYGRSDDHRGYWWKLRASVEAISLYRRDPAAFAREWLSYLPGRPTDAFWYPDAQEQAFPDVAALTQAWREQRLLPVAPAIGHGFQVRPEPLDVAHASLYSGLRRASLGLLRLIAKRYDEAGAGGEIIVGDLTLTQLMVEQARRLAPPMPPRLPLWPPDGDSLHPPGDGPPADFDFHTTGIAFDLLRPADERRRKSLEYVLDRLQDRRILAYADAKDHNERRYHVVPNPVHGDALGRLAIHAP